MDSISQRKLNFEKYARYVQILEKIRWANEFFRDHIKKISDTRSQPFWAEN